MNKVLNIAWKDLLMAFRDPGALIMMLLTPFALTLAIGFAFGGIGGGNSSSGLSNIPVIIVNNDTGELGQNLVDVFESQDLADLLEPVLMEDEAAARALVDADESAAVVVVPDGFTGSVIPSDEQAQTAPDGGGTPAVIQVYGNPTRPVSTNVVRSIVDGFVYQVNSGAVGGRVAVEELLASGLIEPPQAMQVARAVGEQAGRQASASTLIRVKNEQAAAQEGGEFDWLAYMAPSMAIMFLMFTITAGARSVLAERDEGTLPRMLVSPTSAPQVLGGKFFGIYLTGLAQISILLLANTALLGIRWGDWLGVVVLVLAVVFGATGWAALLAAFSRTPAQASNVGTALSLVFAAAAGNFVPRDQLPTWLKNASYISPNAWGLDGFNKLAFGGGLPDVTLPALALIGMGILLFGVALVAFRRQYQ